MNYKWARGSRPPKGVTADDAMDALNELPERSPEELLKASENPKHVLHRELWSEDDGSWAHRGRLERARAIIASIRVVTIVKKRTIETRAIEAVKVTGRGTVWADVSEIVGDSELETSYLDAVEDMIAQALGKLDRYKTFRRSLAADTAKAA